MRTVLGVLGVIVALLAIGWLGFQVRPRPFPDAAEAGLLGDTPSFVPLPAGLPAPVERFYRALYGEQVPVITSVVLDGRGRLKPAGFFMPARFRFVHEAGQGYRHYIEVTWFGFPILRVNERYIDGSGWFEVPIAGEAPDNARLRSAANQALWSESVWLPALWAIDPRVRWTAVDDHTALLTVPFAPADAPPSEQTLVVRFDPASGLVQWTEALRHRDAAVDAPLLWIAGSHNWEELDGWLLPTLGAATWIDQGRPWATFNIESVTYNADVRAYVRGEGL